MEKKTKVVALGLISNDKGEILIIQRSDPKIKDAHLRWDIPGGTNDFGEVLEDTVKREVLEETGLEIEIGKLLSKCVTRMWEHEEYLQHTLVFCYLCKVIKENPLPHKDHKIADMRWERPENFYKYDFLPTTSMFIPLAMGRGA
ncbi:NUDIX hydrolase [Candidatus Kaiserbacteria bacterium]|nr:NUDIX hydrolase [Candidatus Kaiserbacteria bacterium]